MNKEEIMGIFRKTHAFLEGHFELSSGLHSDHYVQCALVLQYPQHAECFGRILAEYVKKESLTCVIGPALGGVTIAYEVARALGVRGIFAERKDGAMQIRRGFSVTSTDRVFVVEDVITTGGSVKEVIGALRETECTIVGVGSIVDRSGGEALFGVPFYNLISLPFKKYEPARCPLCARNIPAVKPGSRTKHG